MLQSLRDQWRKLRGRPEAVAHFADWRAITDGSRPELDYDACILGQSSPGGTSPREPRYEIYIHGKLVATRLGLAVAQAYVDSFYAPGQWTRRKTDPVTVNHYYFGPTNEFGPTYYWTRDL
jgi:hypothetical protein